MNILLIQIKKSDNMIPDVLLSLNVPRKKSNDLIISKKIPVYRKYSLLCS